MPHRQQGDDETLSRFASTTTAKEIDLVWEDFVRPNEELLHNLRSLARAYLDDLGTRGWDAEIQLMSQRVAALRHDVASTSMQVSTCEWLQKHGFLSRRLGPHEELIFLPQHLELFARAVALELGEAVLKIEDIEKAYEMLMTRSEMLPLGDVVGACALRVIAGRNLEQFTDIIYQALADAPDHRTVPTGSSIEVRSKGILLGSIELPEPAEMTGNIHPWLVLAQLAVFPLDGGPEGAPSPNGRIIATIGSSSTLLRRPGDQPWRTTVGFHFHDFPGKGSVPCQGHGVVEPIGQAIISAFYFRPNEMVEMTEYAIEKDLLHLAWRLNTAARELTSAVDQQISEAAKKVVELTDTYFRKYDTELFHDEKDDQPPTTPRKSRKSPARQARNNRS